MKIAIVKLSALGDIVHAMIALQFIRQQFPEAQIDWVVEEGFAGILEHNPDIDHILPVNLKALKKCRSCLFSEIRKIRSYAKNDYDIVIDLQGLIKSAVLSRMLGYAVGFDRHSIREKAASFLYRNAFSVDYKMNVIYRNMKLVDKALGIETTQAKIKDKKPFLFFDEKEEERVASILHQEHNNIVYILGSSWESKIYPGERLLTVIEALGGNAMLVWGNQKERDTADYLASRSAASVLPQLTLGELKALISKADLVIGGDSGPTHIAWALNRPSITLFGPTPARRNTLEGAINKTISSASPVDPMRLNRNDFSIRDIDPMKIIDTARGLLAAADSQKRGDL